MSVTTTDYMVAERDLLRQSESKRDIQAAATGDVRPYAAHSAEEAARIRAAGISCCGTDAGRQDNPQHAGGPRFSWPRVIAHVFATIFVLALCVILGVL